jgi:anti-sigma factor RsiW
MTCSRWHRVIALEVGGDLDPRRSRRLGRHLQGCSACSELAEELRSQRDEFAELDRLAVDSVTLGSVRHAVLANLADRPRPVFRLLAGGSRLAFAAAAAVVLVVAAVVLWRGEAPTQPVVAERAIPTAVAAPIPDPMPSPITDVIVKPLQAVPPSAPLEPVESGLTRLAQSDVPSPRNDTAASRSNPTEPMTVKILTDDPDVVIYWIVDPKGDKEHA